MKELTVAVAMFAAGLIVGEAFGSWQESHRSRSPSIWGYDCRRTGRGNDVLCTQLPPGPVTCLSDDPKACR